MAQNINQGNHPHLFAQTTTANGVVKGPFDLLQTNPDPRFMSTIESGQT